MSSNVQTVLKGLAVALAGAGLTYVGQLVKGGEFPAAYTPLIAAGLTAMSSLLAQWAGQTQTVKSLIGRK